MNTPKNECHRMKYYKIEKSFKLGEEIIPEMNGKNVRNKDDFFANNSFGPKKFCEQDIEFDYLIPMYISEEMEDVTPSIISNYHGWWGESPWGGWLKVISKELKELLEQFNLGVHKFYPAKVLHKDKYHEYYVLQIESGLSHPYIDFSKSRFNNLSGGRVLDSEKKEIRQFDSLDDVRAYAKVNWNSAVNWNYERAVVLPEFKKIDFIMWYRFGDLVSERLKTAIEAAGIKGVEFEELPIHIEFSDEA